jgi:hypothetical protein
MYGLRIFDISFQVMEGYPVQRPSSYAKKEKFE